MAIEMSSDRAVCHRCGKAFSKRRGNFPVSYAPLYKGVGYLPICKECANNMYLSYLEQFDDPVKAIRKFCEKLDLYWNYNIYKTLIKKNGDHTLLTAYLQKLTINSYAGKCYDDTIKEEPELEKEVSVTKEVSEELPIKEVTVDVPDEVKKFWGTGYTSGMYLQLEERRNYWMDRLPEEFDTGVGSEAIIRQICALELDINRDRAEGKAVDKLITTLNGLIGSLNLKPVQKKQDGDDTALANTPMGVWLYRYENERPLPEIQEDENLIRKTVFTWMGHVCKMLGKKNAYSRLYEEEIERLRVEKPEYEDEDDEEFMMDVIAEEGGDDS